MQAQHRKDAMQAQHSKDEAASAAPTDTFPDTLQAASAASLGDSRSTNPLKGLNAYFDVFIDDLELGTGDALDDGEENLSGFLII